jgi:hypothetical protein
MACGRAHLQRWPAPSSRSAEDCRKAASPSYSGEENTENRNRQLSSRSNLCNNFSPFKESDLESPLR